MKTAAITLDNWKLDIFKRRLTEEGFVYKQTSKGLTHDTTVLLVEFESAEFTRLHKLINSMQIEARKSKLQ